LASEQLDRPKNLGAKTVLREQTNSSRNKRVAQPQQAKGEGIQGHWKKKEPLACGQKEGKREQVGRDSRDASPQVMWHTKGKI